ncbi:MAG: CvpA family protein [Lachnospiraceae bacterium]
MSIVMGAVLVIILIFAFRGHCKGIAMEIASLISVLLSLLGVALIIRMVGSYLEENTSGIVQALVFFVVLAFLSQIFRLIITSLKILTKLPVIHFLNGFLGMIVGIAEGVVVVWALFIVITKYDVAGQSLNWLEQIAENDILFYMYEKNPFARFFL